MFKPTDPHSALARRLSVERLRDIAPAIFAERPYVNTSPTYKFISTWQLVEALINEGFAPMKAQQVRPRDDARRGFARHMIRFGYERTSLTLKDAVLQILLINAHDGTGSYDLRTGLYVPICTNGLVTPVGDLGLLHVPHRGNSIIADVVGAALKLVTGFDGIADAVKEMRETRLLDAERRDFAEQAMRIRYCDGQHRPFPAERLLEAKVASQSGHDVWSVFNAVQGNIMHGNVVGKGRTGRESRSRGISAIRQDVSLNTKLWGLAMRLIRR